jgi:hypothetical protein
MSTPPTDPQLKPGFSAPAKCTQGCARWANLAADGNTRNQQEVNQKWRGGSPPAAAGNMCAQPANDPDTAPWCYCAGLNDGSWGVCTPSPTPSPPPTPPTPPSPSADPAVCHSTPNKIQSVIGQISSCTTPAEATRNMDFADKTFNISKDIETLRAVVADSLVVGDNVFSNTGAGEITKQVQARHDELVTKKENLKKEIDKGEAIVERSNRDFSDVKDRVPDPQPKKMLHVIEDYTLAFLVISYLFMVLAGIYVFTSMSAIKVPAFFKALGGSVFLTIFLFMILYYFT